MHPDLIEALQTWVRKAENDLEAARRILGAEEGCPYDTVCFHCQQAAEKYMKALLTMLGIQAPRTHHLGKLLLLVPEEVRPPVDPEEISKLNPYAVDVRYADDLREPQRSDALRSLKLAGIVRADARRRLPPEALPS